MQLGKFIFKPHLGLTLLVIFFLPILLGLSYWQWQRGLYKEELLNSYRKSQTETSIVFKGQSSLPLSEFRPITITGKFDNTHQFYLDNQIYQGRAGFEIILPFQLNNGEWMLVNLGWLPRNMHRNELPTIPVFPTEEITLSGRADFPSSSYLLLGTYLEPNEPHKAIIQAIDYKKLSKFLGVSLLPIVLLADPDLQSPLVRDWQPPTTLPPEKHFGYAIQWLLLAITLCVLYIIFCRKEKL